MRSQRRLSLIFFLSLYYGLIAQAEVHRLQGAHVHGEARLDIAQEGSDLILEFYSPAMDILGFEHEPADETERKMAQEAEKRLRAADTLFKLPENAECKLTLAEVKAGGEMHEAGKGRQEEGGHRDYEAQYAFRCSGEFPAGIEVLLFDAFPSLHRIHAQLAGPDGQKSVELSASENRIEFRQ
ncbi:MAG: DUF2796 domain-containing protein [Gammaproteobacteria bacterium]|nr:DUF2796 domain-containing protein [Gammaproteobacteria bacterium]MBU1655876.1 DUF2796 domain-containing protein [Gammaproteobacteria bacterium]MBU1960619.1 DUF2796 domain-containing protein [Gammaproteobacteria bacterium]